jgi:hypothetical protein
MNVNVLTYPARLGELFDFQGKLAQFWGTSPTPDAPFKITTIRVSHIDSREWPDVIRQVPWDAGQASGRGRVWLPGGREVYVDTDGWKLIKLRAAVPKPRDGLSYTWKWSSFWLEWRKSFFDGCSECRKLHAPDRSHCDNCGTSTRPGQALCAHCKEQG